MIKKYPGSKYMRLYLLMITRLKKIPGNKYTWIYKFPERFFSTISLLITVIVQITDIVYTENRQSRPNEWNTATKIDFIYIYTWINLIIFECTNQGISISAEKWTSSCWRFQSSNSDQNITYFQTITKPPTHSASQGTN